MLCGMQSHDRVPFNLSEKMLDHLTEAELDFLESQQGGAIHVDLTFRGDNPELNDTLERRNPTSLNEQLKSKVLLILDQARAEIMAFIKNNIELNSNDPVGLISDILHDKILLSLDYIPGPHWHRGDSREFREEAVQRAHALLVKELLERRAEIAAEQSRQFM
jgi:hypothetical protein